MTNFILGTIVGFGVGTILGIVIMSIVDSYNKKNKLDDWY